MGEIKIYIVEEREDCEKVVSKLEKIGVDYEVTTVSEDQNKRNEIERITGQKSVPVLLTIENGSHILGSEDIIDHLNENYESKSWRRNKKASDIVYHIVDGIVEFF